ncbi:MAG: sodium:proton antiporter [Desulfuromonadales bacterium]|nr:sodium:proton antiporter [Desulfuromonadales bacterium]
MNTVSLYAGSGIILFSLGLHALLIRRHLLRKILAANIMGSGVFMVFIAMGARGESGVADPVPQAMVLTGIVVSLCFTAVAIVLAVRINKLTGCTTLAVDEESSID